ncbi:MAG TPA: hypothetical protein VJZ91_10400, partial [Blastocatellia bacterium]|nr:hypothetical protein [Blastocatellia bacterium]
QAAIVPANAPPVILGDIKYSQSDYDTTACIQEFALTDAQLGQIATTPVGVVQATAARGGNPASTTVLLQENPAGAYVNATQFVYRLNPGDVVGVELIATQFGEPAVNQTITLNYDNSQIGSSGQPQSALTFPASVTTGVGGRASFCLTAGDPGNPRPYIDGQVYGVGFSWALDSDPEFPPDPNKFISVRVYDPFEQAPTWANLQPILQQYARLYPFMSQKVMNIADLQTIQSNLQALLMVLNIPMTDPRYMPVTRDLSRDKRQRLIEWLNLGAPGQAS